MNDQLTAAAAAAAAEANGGAAPDAWDDEAMQAEAQEKAQQEARRAALQAVVQRRRTEAVNAKLSSGIETIWREDEDQYHGFDELNRPTRTLAPVQNAGKAKRSLVFLNVTQPKTDAAEAKVCEMLLPVDDRPWQFEPTPVPDLGRAVEEQDQTPVTLADGSQVPAAQAAQALLDKAQAAADEHEKWTEDHFVEGKVYIELRKVIKDAARIGTGVIKGPFPVSRQDRRWTIKDGFAKLEIKERVAPTSKRVDPWDFFPDPAAGENIHDGSYCIERDYLTARQLRKLARDPGYLQQEIADVLKEGPKQVARADRKPDNDFAGETQARDSDVFEVWYYYGDVPVEDLRSLGIEDLMEDLDGMPAELSHVAAIVTMVNDRIVKAVLNPLDTGDFPYDVFPWEPVSGQPWGRGVPRKMSVAQRMLNAAARAMLENAGLSAGPQIVIRSGAVRPADGKNEITGRKLWLWDPDDTLDDIRKVMAVFEIPSAQKELAAIIEFAMQMADETAALPMLLQGQQGPAPETVGGMTMLMNNTSSMLRRVAKQFDDSIVVPHLGRWYDFGMQYGPEGIKGDLQVRARGSSTLVQRDQSNQFLMQSAPMLQNPEFRIDPAKWFVEVCKSNHFDPKSIQYTDADWKAKKAEMAKAPPPADPRVEAAHVRAEAVQAQIEAKKASDEQRLAFEAQDAAAQREHERIIKSIEREIQVMEFAGRREISLEQIKAMLASKAADLNNKADLFAQEKALKLATGQGI